MTMLLTAKEAAAKLGLGYTTVLDLAKKGMLPHIRLGDRYYYTEEGLERHFAACEGKSVEKDDEAYSLLKLAIAK